MKVQYPKKRRKLADQVARNELSLVKLRERIEGRKPRAAVEATEDAEHDGDGEASLPDEDGWTANRTAEPISDDSLITAKAQLNEAVEDLLDVIRNPEVLGAIGPVVRTNLAKYLTIAKLRLENAIAVVRTGESDR